MEQEIILAYFRGSERLLIVLFGGMSLLLGWHLFSLGVVKDQRAEIKKGDFSVNFQKVGPGVFFALFGSAILALSISYQLGLSGDEPPAAGPVYALSNSNKQQLFQQVQAINSLKRIGVLPNTSDYAGIKSKILRSTSQLYSLREELIRLGVGDSAYSTWKKHRNDYMSNRDLIDDEKVLRVLDDVNKWNTAGEEL